MSMVSAEGEEVAFSEPVITRGSVEDWLTAIETMMCHTISVLTKCEFSSKLVCHLNFLVFLAELLWQVTQLTACSVITGSFPLPLKYANLIPDTKLYRAIISPVLCRIFAFFVCVFPLLGGTTQPITVVDQIVWTANAQRAILSGALPSFLDFSRRQIDGMVELVRTDLGAVPRATVSALIVLDVHARDVVAKMIQMVRTKPRGGVVF